MAFQLVYTSAGKLLDAGRSGFGTVARSKSISPLVVSAIERVSQFANLRGLDRTRVIHVHRRITAGSNRFHILTRIVDAGADYTGRTNHLAHHLVVSQEEAARAAARGITPADVLRQFPWLDRWDGAARFFDATEDVPLENFRPDGQSSGGQHWAAITGNPAHARLLSWEAAPRTGVLVLPDNLDTLHLLAEALAEFGPQSWTRSFTTSLETTDELSELEWIVTTPAVFPEIQSRCGSRALLDLTQPGTLPTPPAPAVIIPPVNLAPVQPSNGATTSGEKPIRIKIAEKGSRDASAAHRRSNPKQDKKTQIKLLVGFAALLFFAGLVVVLIVKDQAGPTPKADTEMQRPSAEARVSDQDEQAGKDLVDSGIKKSEADLLVKKAGKDAKILAKFVKDTNNVLNGFDSNFTLNDLNKLPKFELEKEPAGSSSWIASLVSGATQLREVPNLKLNTIAAQNFLDLANAIKNLNIVLSDGYDQERLSTKPNREKLFNEIARPWLAEIIKLEKYGELEATLNHKDIWDKSEFSARHQLLETTIDDAFNKTKNPNSDFKKLFGLLGKTGKFDEQLKRIRLANTEDAGSLDTQNAKVPVNPSSQIMDDVPEKEILLVSTEDLKRGVQVKLLRAVIAAKIGETISEKINLENLTIKIGNDMPIEKFDLLRSEEVGEKFYCKTLRVGSNEPKYYLDGRVAISKDNITRVDVRSSKKDATIMVDEASTEAYSEKLLFKITPIDGSTGKLEGTLAAAIKLISPIDAQRTLIIQMDSKDLRWNWKQTNNGWILVRSAPAAPPLRFSLEDTQSMKNDLDDFKRIGVRISETSPGSEKSKLEDQRSIHVLKLRSSLCTAIGGAILLSKLKLNTHEMLKSDQWPQAKRVLEELKITRSSSFDTPETDMPEIKKKLGEAKLDEEIAINSTISKNWDSLKNSPKSLGEFVDGLITKSNNFKPDSSYSDAMKNIQSITVISAKGRVLFKATKEPQP